jgi:hypothetical protein
MNPARTRPSHVWKYVIVSVAQAIYQNMVFAARFVRLACCSKKANNRNMIVSSVQTKLGKAISEKAASAVNGMYTLFECDLLPIIHVS